MNIDFKNYSLLFLMVVFIGGCGSGSDSEITLKRSKANEEVIFNIAKTSNKTVDFTHNITADTIYYNVLGDGLGFIGNVDVSYSSEDKKGTVVIEPLNYVGLTPGEYKSFVDIVLCASKGCKGTASNTIRFNFKYVIPDIRVKSDRQLIEVKSDHLNAQRKTVKYNVRLEAPNEYRAGTVQIIPEYSEDIIDWFDMRDYVNEIRLKQGRNLGAGDYHSKITYRAYYYGDKSTPVIAAPVVVDINYIVQELPLLKLSNTIKLNHDVVDFSYIPSMDSIAIASIGTLTYRDEYTRYTQQDSVYIYGLNDGQSYEFDFQSDLPSTDIGVNYVTASNDNSIVISHYKSVGIVDLNKDDLSLSKISNIPLPPESKGGKPVISSDYIYLNSDGSPSKILSINLANKQVSELVRDNPRTEYDKYDFFVGDLGADRLYGWSRFTDEVYNFSIENKLPVYLGADSISTGIFPCRPVKLLESGKLYDECGGVFDASSNFQSYASIDRKNGTFSELVDIIDSVNDDEVIALVCRKGSCRDDSEAEISIRSSVDITEKARYRVPKDNGKGQYGKSLFKDKKGNVWLITAVREPGTYGYPEYYNLSQVVFPLE